MEMRENIWPRPLVILFVLLPPVAGCTFLQAKSTEDLIKIAAAASDKGARIIVTKASGKATDDLIRIAAAGKGCVLFDLAS